MENPKTVFTDGNYSIVRVRSYGFGCNSLSTSWEIHLDGQFLASTLTLKDAKKLIKILT